MPKRNVLLLLFALVITRFTALAQDTSPLPAPFGIRMNAAKGDLGPLRKEWAPFLFEITTVPKPHADFELYMAEVTPRSGVCFVKALSKDVPTSIYGEELRAKFDQIKAQIESVHGKATVLDHLRAGSIWNEPRDWMMGMLKKERVLFARWSPDDGLIMKYGIKEIILIASALSTEKGFIGVEYYFTNYDRCEAEVKDNQKNVF
jgi:hypothetical protein